MQIADPHYLLLVWIAPVLAVFYVWALRRRESLLQEFARSEMLARLLPPASYARAKLKAALLSTAVVFVLLSLLRPQWGFQWEEISRRGVDILVAVDVSQSMLAQDVKPTRIEHAKRELIDLLEKLQGDRVGLIAFAGTAFVQCPLTLDYSAFALFLDQINPDLIPVPGTSLASAIRIARQSFLEQSSTSRALILITDGEDHEGDPLEAAKEAREAGIQIYTIGIGAEEGAPIPNPDGSGFVKDASGQLVMTRLDEQTLQRIAVETGGAYVRSTTGDLDLDRIYFEGIKKSLQDAELTSTRQKRWEERFQWPLGLAILLILLEPFVGRRRRRVPGSLLGLALLGILGSSQSARAGLLGDGTIRAGIDAYQNGDFETALQKFTDAQIDHPEDPLLDYNLGNAYYKARRYDEAAASFARVIARSPDPRLRERAYYNLGNTAFRQGKLDAAVEHYLEALKLNPQDEDARKNLERTREEIRRRMEQQKERQQQKEQQQQQQQDQPQGDQDQGQGGAQEQSQGGGKEQPNDQGQQAQQGQDQQPQGADPKQAGGEKPGEEEQAQQAQPRPGSDQDQKQAQAQGAGQGADPTPNPSGQDEQGAQAQGREGAQAGEQQGDQENGTTAASPGQLTREEAERLLNQVRDAQGAGQRGQSQHATGGVRNASGGKPW